jgi:hypothetical protein
MLTTKQVAARLGISTRQVLRYLESGLFQKAEQLGDYPTAPWAIPEESLTSFLLEKKLERDYSETSMLPPKSNSD